MILTDVPRQIHIENHEPYPAGVSPRVSYYDLHIGRQWYCCLYTALLAKEQGMFLFLPKSGIEECIPGMRRANCCALSDE